VLVTALEGIGRERFSLGRRAATLREVYAELLAPSARGG
jgi:hypothetical protein